MGTEDGPKISAKKSEGLAAVIEQILWHSEWRATLRQQYIWGKVCKAELGQKKIVQVKIPRKR